MKLRVLSPILWLVASASAVADSGSVKIARICSSDPSLGGQFVKMIGYPDDSFRIEECYLSRVDEVGCRDIKGYSTSGAPGKEDPLIAFFPGDPSYDRRKNREQLLATVTGNIGRLFQITREAAALEYARDALKTSKGPFTCAFYEGNYVEWVDTLKSALGPIPTRVSPFAKANFLEQVSRMETERHSVWAGHILQGDKLYYTRTKSGEPSGDAHTNGLLLPATMLPQPPEAPPVQIEPEALSPKE